MSWASTKFPALPFNGPYENPQDGVLGLIKNYHLRLDPKLGNGTFTIRWIPGACNAFKNRLEKPWAIFIDLIDQQFYQLVKD